MSTYSSRPFALHRIAAAMAVAALPLTAFAWGSQAGDNGQQPIGADNEGPRQAIPNEMSNHVPIQTQIRDQGGTVYYVVPDGYSAAIYDCDREPLTQRADCRDAAAALYGVPSESYVETYPGYMTYYRAPSVRVYRSYAARPEYYAATPDYYVYSPYGASTGYSGVNPTSRCIPAYGAGAEDCLHGTQQGQ